MSNSALETELLTAAGRVATTRCHWLLLLAELDAREAWRDLGFRSCVHWLVRRMGLSRRTAAEQLRVAAALGRLPLVTERFLAGKISYSKVRAITRLATPATEREWLKLAEVSTSGQLEAAARATGRGGGTSAAGPGLRWDWDRHGNLQVRLTLPAAQGETLARLLENLVLESDVPEQRADGPDAEPLAAQRAAALLVLLDQNTTGAPPTDPTTHRRTVDRRRMPRPDRRHGARTDRHNRVNRRSNRSKSGPATAAAARTPQVPAPRPSRSDLIPTVGHETEELS